MSELCRPSSSRGRVFIHLVNVSAYIPKFSGSCVSVSGTATCRWVHCGADDQNEEGLYVIQAMLDTVPVMLWCTFCNYPLCSFIHIHFFCSILFYAPPRKVNPGFFLFNLEDPPGKRGGVDPWLDSLGYPRRPGYGYEFLCEAPKFFRVLPVDFFGAPGGGGGGYAPGQVSLVGLRKPLNRSLSPPIRLPQLPMVLNGPKW